MADDSLSIENFEWLLGRVPRGSNGIGLPRGEISIYINNSPSERNVRIGKGQDRIVVITREGDRLAFAYHRIANGYQPLADPAFERETPALFARALGIVREQIARTDAAVVGALREPVPEALDEIARSLVRGPELAAILEELALCRADKARYVKQLAKRLRRRGVREVVPGLGWIALIDALIEHGHAFEVDWKAEWDEVEAVLDQLVSRALPDRRIAWSEELAELETGEALAAASTALAGTGHALIHLHGDGDSYVVALALEAAIAQVTYAARTAGHEISQTFR